MFLCSCGYRNSRDQNGVKHRASPFESNAIKVGENGIYIQLEKEIVIVDASEPGDWKYSVMKCAKLDWCNRFDRTFQ